MEIFEAIHGRRSIRAFTSDPVKDEDLKKILEAGIAAPSAGNRQPWEFVVVRSAQQKRALAEAAFGQSFVEHCIQDTAAAVQNIHLAAYALGYGTCWVGAFDEQAVAKVIKAPKDVRPVAIIPIGRPSEKPRATPRLPLSKVVRDESF